MRTVRTGCLVYLLAVCLSGALAPRPSTAQDTHYWNNQYGPKSMLLGGAVIGSVHDMSATYYNPGAMGYIEKPEVLLSANAYQIQNLSIHDGGGDGIDLKSTQFNLLPNMLAGAFRKSWLGKNKIAYSFLTRHRFDAEVKGARTERVDILPDSLGMGDEEVAGTIRAEAGAKELWAGVTWARGLSEKIGVGITTYLSIRHESGVSEFFAQALTDSADISLVYNVDNFSSDVYSLLWKAGVGFNFYPLTFGVTLTTPNLQLTGSGETVLNETQVRLPDNSFETDIQQDVPANYKSPLSVGFGAGYFFEHTELHFAAEWFANVDAYDILELEPFVSQTTGEPVSRSLRQARESVFNFAVGVEQDLGEKYGGFLSFTMDNSAYSEESNVSTEAIDIYHATGGVSAIVGRTRWMLGLSYAWGNQKTEQLINLNPDAGSADEVEIAYSRVTFLIGFRVGL